MEVLFHYQPNGRLKVRVTVPGTDQQVATEIVRENSLSKEHLDGWRQAHLRPAADRLPMRFTGDPMKLKFFTAGGTIDKVYFDTMIETAKRLLGISGKTIVLTGSMQPACFKVTDAAFNVGAAIMAAQCLPPGVYIAINGRIFAPARCRKNRQRNCFEGKV